MIILRIEILLVWWLINFKESFYRAFNDLKFWLSVLSGLVCYYSFNNSSVVTQIKNNEIIKEVFIGRD